MFGFAESILGSFARAPRVKNLNDRARMYENIISECSRMLMHPYLCASDIAWLRRHKDVAINKLDAIHKKTRADYD